MAQGAWPNKPIKLLLGFAPGGPPDVVARLVANGLTERLGQQVVVENKPGASANLASQQAARTEPDGYTILLIVATNTINQTLYPNLDFHIVNDFTPVASIMRVPNIVLVTPSIAINTIPELIAYAKANPGKLNYASAGAGTSPHIIAEMFKSMADVDITHVPYITSNYMPDLLSGRVQLMFGTVPGVMGLIRAGQIRAIAVTTQMRVDTMPDLPTVGETVPGYENSGWYGIVAPKGTPAPIVEQLNREIVAVMNDPKIKARLPDLGGTEFNSTPGEFGAFVAGEVERWGKVIKARNIRPE